jgi:phage tail-like protein
MATTRVDPFQGYNFAVEMNGITRMGFKQCSGLDSTTAAVKYREGTDATLAQRQLPGLLTFSNITLQRGITNDHALWDWRNSIASGASPSQRMNISIILNDNAGNEQIRWNIINAWPTKWTGPSFDATSDTIAIEQLELVHEGVVVQSW